MGDVVSTSRTAEPRTHTAAPIHEAFAQLRSTGDRGLRDRLVMEHRWLAIHCARRFDRRGEPLEDLEQVALLGLVKAVERFDPEHGAEFASFAIPTVLGELRRHFRDTTWAVKVSRRMKDLTVLLGPATEDLTAALGRTPTVPELAEHTGLRHNDILEALEARSAYRTAELDPQPLESDSAPPTRGVSQERGFEDVENRATIDTLMGMLPERERAIVALHYFDGLSQSQIADRMGISQVHVSRLLRATLDRLRCAEHELAS